MNFLDLFSGIGGFRLGMEWAGHKCLGYVEFDKYARQAYQAIHNTEGEWTGNDITEISDDDIRQLRGRVDCITGGFPCQAFSIAGRRKGFEDTRGTLFFEIARFAKILNPRYLLLENVKGLLNHEKGATFGTILSTLSELGYFVEWQVLNSKDFGVPQNRERVFIVGHLGSGSGREVFPVGGNDGEALKQIIGGPQGYRVYDTSGTSCTLASEAGGLGAKTGLYKVAIPYSVRDEAHCLTATPMSDYLPKITDGYRIRKLTPKECFRLQGFPDEYFQRAKDAGISDSQLYKLAGNSVTVNVVWEIARKLT